MLMAGLAGAELATIANEAAISAARRGSQQLLETDFLVRQGFLSVLSSMDCVVPPPPVLWPVHLVGGVESSRLRLNLSCFLEPYYRRGGADVAGHAHAGE